MKKVFFLVALLTTQLISNAQRYSTKNATASFINSKNKDVAAVNKAGTFVIDAKTGGVAMSILIKSFTFENATMQDHFNDNYMDSKKYPNSEFKGTITNNTDIKYTTDGTYTAKVAGKLTLHGVTKDVTTNATITVKSGKISGSTVFDVKLKDYKINTDGIGSSVKITIQANSLTAVK